MKKIILIIILFFSVIGNASAGIKEYWEILKNNIYHTWSSDKYDAYVPLYAWHNRLTYNKEHIDKYNENPWGIGVGKSYTDIKGNWHGLYAMAFKDSNKHLETFLGYAFMKNWQLGDNSDFKVGLGYTLGVTQRKEWYYLLMPAPLPIAGISYRKIALQATYVPGLKNNGNVLFVWTKIAIN